MNREELLLSLRAAVATDDAGVFPVIVKQNHPADIVGLLSDFESPDICRLLARVPAAARAELFGYFDVDQQVELVRLFSRKALADLFVHMSSDERADLYNLLSEDEQEQLLPALAQVEREDIRRLASYEEGTAGAVMTSDYATLLPELTASQSIERLRREAPDKETIYQAYVVDDNRRLVGTVSLRDLIVAPAHARVEQIMKKDPVFIRVGDEREAAAGLISKYDLIALPVINGGDRLVGIVTYDDAMDVAQEEATEDFQKAGGSAALVTSVRDASVRSLYRSRVFWLVVLVFGNIFSGAGIAHFEETIAAHIALLFFLPLLIASAGNAGSQAATLMVRALATGDVQARDWGWMLGRELLVATALGLTMAFAISGIGIWRGGTDIATVVALTMVIVVVIGSLIGMSLPFLLSRFRLDPATASAPLVTSIADVAGVVIYFGIAAALLAPAAMS